MRQVSLGINPRKTVHSERPGQVPGLFRRRRAQRVTVFAPQRTMPSPLPLYLPRARRAAPLVPVFFQSRPSPSKRARPQGRGIRGIPLSIGSNAGLRKTAPSARARHHSTLLPRNALKHAAPPAGKEPSGHIGSSSVPCLLQLRLSFPQCKGRRAACGAFSEVRFFAPCSSQPSWVEPPPRCPSLW